MRILAIDPGNIQTAYVLMDSEDCKPIEFGKQENALVRDYVMSAVSGNNEPDVVVIERVACYGMPVGREVFDTCEWIGRFAQVTEMYGGRVEYIYRSEEKIAICHDSKAKDANIRQALIDRFAQFDFKNGKGTKDKPDFFYGFKADIWAAESVGVTFVEKMKQAEMKEQ